MVLPSNRTSYDPLDPFAEKEELFESKDIKKSKAREAKRRADYLKKKEKTETKAKKPSLFSRIKTFFKELPDREDKKKVYARLALAPILIIAVVISVVFLINNRNHALIIEETKAEIESAHTDFFWGDLNEEEDLENYKLEIEEKYNSTDDPDLKFLYRKELINFYYEDEEKSQEVIGWINEQLSYEKITTPEKVNLLVALIDLYKMNDMIDESKNALRELLNIPDDGEMTFGGETFAELKARIKNENS